MARIAKTIGQPGAARAVGAANGANPIALMVPCHRVIGSDGSLTGYAGGLPLKRKLWNMRRASRARASTCFPEDGLPTVTPLPENRPDKVGIKNVPGLVV